MEILSTGEKIKRARIYKGLTLKEICDNKISVSKMSCIENDKIKPELWILEFISHKLGVAAEYLEQDVRAQLIKNIEILENNKNDSKYEDKLLYNLGFAEKYKYYDLAFKIMHMLFNYYINNEKKEKLQANNSKYYEFFQKCCVEENRVIYYNDIARYLFCLEEYLQAANYFNNVRKTTKNSKDYTLLAKSTFNEAACYLNIENYERAYEIAVRLEELICYLAGDEMRAEAYLMLAMLSLRLDKGRFKEFEEKSYELFGDNLERKAYAIYNYSVAMYQVGLKEGAVEYTCKALECHPHDNKERYIRFAIFAIDALIEYGELDEAQRTCDTTLNYAIAIDDIKYIERAYYFKALIMEKQNNLISSEMYMNLSLDALVKFGNKQEIYKRYMDMGHMYHKLGYISESLKYFTLALSLEKKI